MIKPLAIDVAAADNSAQYFDVIVVGAGLAGSSLACALAQADAGLSIAVIEPQPLLAQMPSLCDEVNHYDTRVSALTVQSQSFLASLSVWPQIEAQRIGAYQRMHVWDAEGTGSVSFNAHDVNEAVLGHIVENVISVAALAQQLRLLPNVQCYNPAKMAGIEAQPSAQRRLQLEDGRVLTAPLVVAADGANSAVRQQAGFELREWDYHHHAIVATVQTSQHHQHTAWQCFLPEGPLAFLPLGVKEGKTDDGYLCSIVWSTLPAHAEALMALSDDEFSEQLARAFENRLGNIEAVSKRYSLPLRQRHAIDYVKPGLALVADAAHTIHPLAGQGINIGLNDVQVLAEEILRARQRSMPLDDFSILKRYQRRRKSDNLSMMLAMDGFKRLFAEPSLAVRWLRNAGMHWFNRSERLKRSIIRSAMGLR